MSIEIRKHMASLGQPPLRLFSVELSFHLRESLTFQLCNNSELGLPNEEGGPIMEVFLGLVEDSWP